MREMKLLLFTIRIVYRGDGYRLDSGLIYNNKKRWVKEKLLNFCYHFQFGYVDVNCEKVMHEENFKK